MMENDFQQIRIEYSKTYRIFFQSTISFLAHLLQNLCPRSLKLVHNEISLSLSREKDVIKSRY